MRNHGSTFSKCIRHSVSLSFCGPMFTNMPVCLALVRAKDGRWAKADCAHETLPQRFMCLNR